MGIRCSRWVTMHGFAFNVNTDLHYFNHIVPCGIEDKAVTSLAKILDHPVDEAAVKKRITKNVAAVFDVEIKHTDTIPELEGDFSYLKNRLRKYHHLK